MSQTTDNSYLGKGIISNVVVSMSYNVGDFSSVAYQFHSIIRITASEQFVIGSPSTQWRVLNVDGTPNLAVPVRTQEIPPGPEEREAEVDATLPKGPKVGTIKLQQSNDNILFSDVPTYIADVFDNGDIMFSLTNPLAQYHRLVASLNSAQVVFWVRVCARISRQGD